MQELIEQFESGGPRLLQAIAGLSREQLLARPIPGKWSIQELVIHLQDSDSVAIDRMKRMIAEETPLLIAFDENLYIGRLHTDDQSAQDAAVIFDLSRRQFARVLRRLDEPAWSRAGVHNVRGRLTLLELLKIYANHLDHHLKFLAEKRQALESQ